jgi:hypothetical protein
LDPEDPRTFMLHDYSAFTSNMTEIKFFVKALSEFYKDTWIDVVDVYLGVIQLNLGQYLADYSSENLENPLFDVSRIVSDPDLWRHRRAGMLGVYGNIALCTLLHGIHLAMICNSPDALNCVGDDAAYYPDMQEYTMERVKAGICLLGGIKAENFQVFSNIRYTDEDIESPHWHFLKRPIFFLQGNLCTEELLDFPLLSLVQNFKDPHHTVEYGSVDDRRRSFVMQYSRFLERLPSIRSSLEDRDLLLQIIGWYYHRLSLPREGSLPPHSIPYLQKIHIAIPPVDEKVFAYHWLDILFWYSDKDYVSFPKTAEKEDPDYTVQMSRLPIDAEVEVIGFKGMALLEDLGYISRSPVTIHLDVCDETRILYREFLKGQLSSVYRCKILRSFPSWWQETETWCVD